MNKKKLDEEMEKLIGETQRPEIVMFLKLLRQVWQIDWTVAPYDVWTHFIEWDIPYFRRFMTLDEGDEDEEMELLQEWITSRAKGAKDQKSWQGQVVELIERVNNVRSSVANFKEYS
ncbi:hypothetical protein BCD67_02570 [Oscillatoriales cyanobacterium USR001]|nr:hypothetical protein BCD67_02570 [Oscillatoriales cyanobacterium USR001]